MEKTFAQKVKTELCQPRVERKCCAVAEAYGVLLYAHSFSAKEIRITTASDELAARLPHLMRRAFGIDFDEPEKARGVKHSFRVTDLTKLCAVFDVVGNDMRSPALHINFGVIEEPCCKASFIRGAFLAGGSVTDPEKRYHLELAGNHRQASRELCALLTEMGFLPRMVIRGAATVIYFKQSEHIEDLLTKLGAPVAAMDIMTTKVDKAIRNGANRAMNCDIANVNKILEAATEQQSAIEALAKSGQLDRLPEKLQQTARLRLEHPELSLAQLAELCDPPVSKSCMNHRMRKLNEEAKKLL